MTHETSDYNAKLAQDLADIGGKVKRGMLPLVARNPALERATSTYVLAREDHFEEKRAEAVGKGRPPTVVPPAYRDCNALDKAADLVLYEELTWSHPDKMSIVEYPVMSDRGEQSYFDKYQQHPDLVTQEDRHIGRRKTYFTDDYGAPQVRNPLITPQTDPTIDAIGEYSPLYGALANAGLTERQREAIDLVYFGNMTQEAAADVMGVRRQTLREHLDGGIAKLYDYMTNY